MILGDLAYGDAADFRTKWTVPKQFISPFLQEYVHPMLLGKGLHLYATTMDCFFETKCFCAPTTGLSDFLEVEDQPNHLMIRL